MNLFKYEEQPKKFKFYVNVNGENKALKFGVEYDPYSGSMMAVGRRCEKVVVSTFIDFEKENNALYESVASFAKWAEESKKELDQFLKENNLTISDIKVLKIEYPKPVETAVDINLEDLM